MFNRLIRLFPKYEGNIPLENFTTEVLAGILEKDKNLLEGFINDILKIKGEDFKITTQEYHQGKCIDMVIKNHDTICFLENKIEAKEGREQLGNYNTILKGYKEQGKITHLRYCTKYLEEDKNNLDNFEHFRWIDILNFMKKPENNNPFIPDFLTFLTTQRMATDTKITDDDIKAMKGLPTLLNKLEEYKGIFKSEFEAKFGKSNNPDGFNSIRDRSDLIVRKTNIIGKKGCEIGVGISFRYEEPHFAIWLWIDKNNEYYHLVKSKLEVHEGYFQHHNDNGISFTKDISEFTEAHNPNIEIKEWVKENLEKLKDFFSKTSELGWLNLGEII